MLTSLSYICLILLTLLIMVGIFHYYKKNTKIKTNQLVFSAVAMALAIVTSFIKPISLPFGGSSTLFSMFIITFIGTLYGTKIGVLTGVAYGMLQLILGPYLFHPIQILLDFPLAFGSLGLSGLFYKDNMQPGLFLSKFKTRTILGYMLGVFGRYLCHVISGYIFFKEYAPIGSNTFIYTLSYNASYILPELVLTIIVLLLPPINHLLFELKKMSVSTR